PLARHRARPAAASAGGEGVADRRRQSCKAVLRHHYYTYPGPVEETPRSTPAQRDAQEPQRTERRRKSSIERALQPRSSNRQQEPNWRVRRRIGYNPRLIFSPPRPSVDRVLCPEKRNSNLASKN